MQASDNAISWYVPHLDNLHLFRATIIHYAFKKHLHDYFVIGMVETGVQKFSYGRDTYITPPTGLIVINPGEAHTGEAAVPSGFRYRALYPEAAVLQKLAAEIKGRSQPIPFFSQPMIEDKALFAKVQKLHIRLEASTSTLEHESLYLETLSQLIIRHADTTPYPLRGRERKAIAQIRQYIHDHYCQDIKLDDLARLVHWNAFYMLRVFRESVGLPPHAYLENVRIREAQRLLKSTLSLAEVAYETGFSSQSHFTTTFKRLIGVTPGQYAQQVNFLKDR